MPVAPVDTHTHVVSGDTERYPRPSGLGDELDWLEERPVDAAAMLAAAEAAGVAGVVFVQAMSCYAYDNRYALDSARSHPGRATAVAAVRADAPDAGAALRRVVDDGASGVRISVPAGASGFDDPVVQRLAGAAGDLGVPVLLVGYDAFLASIGGLAAAVPRTTLVVDHCNYADLAHPGSDSARALLALSDAANVVLKVSSINLQATDDPAALWTLLVGRVGGRRLVWGSDHSHSDGPGYAPLVDLARRSTAGLGDADRAEVLAGTALRLWPTLRRDA